MPKNTRKKSAANPKMTLKKLRSLKFGKRYAVFSVVILLASSFVWAWLGARLHQTNADQLIDSYFFQNWSSFHGANFPGSHTFLIKWPLFWIVGLLGYSNFAFI